MVTIREVAAQAGVSIGTVSRFLNGKQLKKENMENIEKAIKELGYEENIIAKGLKNNKSLSIGVLVNSLTDIFATSIVSHLENHLEENNYSIILSDYQNDNKRLEKKLEFMKSRSVDGVVIFHLEENLPILTKMKEQKIAIVAVDAPIKNLKVDTVLVDNYQASFKAVDTLFELGHNKIGVIAGQTGRYIGNERLNGYIDSMKQKGIYNKEFIEIADYTRQSGYMKTKELLKNQKITAIYSTNYYMTLGAVQAIQEANLSIPQDISIIGFDHFELVDIIQPKLTVIEQPIEKMGEMIGKLILEQIKNEFENRYTTVELETNLLLRDSVKKI
ncbi:MAG: LacI family transcriptional regulator [Streptococcaceae bacterium]|nr:LacI family transcriptional regulator [Streptococcaceae bacterium]